MTTRLVALVAVVLVVCSCGRREKPQTDETSNKTSNNSSITETNNDAELILRVKTKLAVEKDIPIKEVVAGERSEKYASESNSESPTLRKLPLTLAFPTKSYEVGHVAGTWTVFFPWQLIKEITSEKEAHIVTTVDGSQYKGTFQDGIALIDNEGREYSLRSCKNILVKKVPSKKSDQTPKETWTLQVDNPKLEFVTLQPKIIGGLWTERTVKDLNGKFRIRIDEEEIEGYLPDFDKFVFYGLEATKETRKRYSNKLFDVMVTTRTGQETKGVFMEPRGVDSAQVLFDAVNGISILMSNFIGSSGPKPVTVTVAKRTAT